MSLWVTKCLLLKKIYPSHKSISNKNKSIKEEASSDMNNIFRSDLKQEEKSLDDGRCRFFLSTEKLCRLCENYADISVFRRVDDIDISSTIQIVTNITVKKEDWYPKYICETCLQELKAAFMFKIKCQQTDMKYRQLTGIEIATSTGVARHDFNLLLQKMAKGIKIFHKPYKKNDTELSPNDSPEQESREMSVSPLNSFPPSPVASVEDYSVPIKVSNSPKNIENTDDPPKLRKRKEKQITVKKRMKKDRESIKKRLKRDRELNSKKNRSCIKCDAVFPDEEKFREHYTQSACKRTQCPQCHKMVLNLRIHTRRMHPSGVVFKCQHCDKAYPIMSVLQRHMLVHTNNYDYPCTLCSYRGKRKEYLKIHMRSHGTERYLCSECPATFVNQSNFNKHRLVHMNKQYQCEKCKKSFRYAKLLQIHDEAQHQKIQHPCTICGQIFKYRSKLLKHELKVHNRTKRKLNEFSATIQLVESKEQNMDISSVDNVPIETYLHFKKDPQNDEAFYSRNFDQR